MFALRRAIILAVLAALAAPLLAADKTDTSIKATWQDYMKDCGLKAQKANQARTEKVFREKYNGELVNWTGKVHSVSEKLIGSGLQLDVTMKPTEALLDGSDLTLDVPDDMKDSVLSMNKGDTIIFFGRFASQGGAFTNHQLKMQRSSK